MFHRSGDQSPCFQSCASRQLKTEVSLNTEAKFWQFGVGFKDNSIVSLDFYSSDGKVVSVLRAKNLVFNSDPHTKYIKQDIGQDEAIVGIYGHKGSLN